MGEYSYGSEGDEVVVFCEAEQDVIDGYLTEIGKTSSGLSVCGRCCGVFVSEEWFTPELTPDERDQLVWRLGEAGGTGRVSTMVATATIETLEAVVYERTDVRSAVSNVGTTPPEYGPSVSSRSE